MADLIDFKDVKDFLRTLATGWDCDTGANSSHPYYCRKCNAEKLLEELSNAESRKVD